MKKTIDVCSYCGTELTEEELESPREDDSGSVMCDECYSDHYENVCPICQDTYVKPTIPSDTYFVVSKATEEEAGLKAGFYQALNYPIFSAAIGGLGPTFIYANNCKLLRACDIDSMLNKIHGKGNHDNIGTEFCCPDCVDLFLMKNNLNRIRTHWLDPFMNIHMDIYKRGVIQDGK